VIYHYFIIITEVHYQYTLFIRDYDLIYPENPSVQGGWTGKMES